MRLLDFFPRPISVLMIHFVGFFNFLVGISSLGQNSKPRNCFASAPFDLSFVDYDPAQLNQTPDNYYGIIMKKNATTTLFKFYQVNAYIFCVEWISFGFFNKLHTVCNLMSCFLLFETQKTKGVQPEGLIKPKL